MNAPATKVTPISGFPELLPAERLLELHFLDVIREVFELHGFAPLETRAVEPVERLLGKGGDADKEIYGISRLAGDDSGRDAALGLHFDLTVPFARYVLENAGKLAFPFRRYQIQKVWRGERPQEGRFREFTQADIDVVDVGELAPHFEAEMPLVIAEAFRRLPVGEFRIQVNNRKIPEGFYLGIGLDDVATTLRIVDKLAKIGPGPVAEMLIESGASEDQARQVLALASISSTDLSFVDAVRALGVQHPTLDEGLEALAAVIAVGLEQAPGVLVADLQHRPRPRLLHRHGLRDPARRVRVVGLGVLGRALRLAGHRRPHHLPRGRHLDRPDPPGAPARHQARPHREPLHPGGRARRGRRRGEPRDLAAGGGGAAVARHPVRGRAQRSEVRQADPLRRPARHPVRLVPGRRGGRRPGQGHPLGRAGRRRRGHLAVPAGGPAPTVVTP